MDNSVNIESITLDALVRLLKLEGFDLSDIQEKYEAKILDNVLSGSSPQFKIESIKVLKKAIEDA